MTAPTDQRTRLRGSRSLCPTCGHLFGSVTAFDRHLRPIDAVDWQDPNRTPCLTVAEFTAPTGKRQTPRLVWHPTRHLWVTRLRDMEAAA